MEKIMNDYDAIIIRDPPAIRSIAGGGAWWRGSEVAIIERKYLAGPRQYRMHADGKTLVAKRLCGISGPVAQCDYGITIVVLSASI